MGKNKDFYPDPNQNPYRVRGGAPTPPVSRASSPPSSAPVSNAVLDFENQRICPGCGKIIKISYKFCKFCGLNLTSIETLKDSDDISRQLAITAITDRDSTVRKEAVETLGNFKEISVLGVLTYVLLNDPDESVRKEAADELGDMANPISLDAMTKALKDESPLVRKEAIEGLKKIRSKMKSGDHPEEKQEKSEDAQMGQKSKEDDTQKNELMLESEDEEEKKDEPDKFTQNDVDKILDDI